MQYTTVIHTVRKQLGLSCNEYCIADIIYHFSNNPKAPVLGWCSASRGKMAEDMDLSKRTVQEIIKTLETKGIVERNSKTDFVRTTIKWYDLVIAGKAEIKSESKTINPHAESSPPMQKVHPLDGAESSQGMQNLHGGGAESSQDGGAESSPNNNSIDNNTNKEKKEEEGNADALPTPTPPEKIITLSQVRVNILEAEEKKEDPPVAPTPPKKAREPMIVPTLQQIRTHFNLLMSPEWLADKFFNYYESNGWRVGKNPMKKWQATANNWISDEKQNPSRNATNNNFNGRNSQSVGSEFGKELDAIINQRYGPGPSGEVTDGGYAVVVDDPGGSYL